MNVCYILSGHFGRGSGAGVTLWCMAERISLRHRVVVYANTWDPDVASRITMRRLPLLMDPRGTAGFFLPYRILSNFFAATRLCRSLPSEFDVLHIYNGLAVSRDLIISQLMCQRAVIRRRARESFRAALSQKTPKHLLLLLLEGWVYGRRLYRKIVPASEFEKTQILQHYGLPPGDIVPVHGGVDYEAFNPPDRERLRRSTREELGFAPSDVMLLFIGFDFRRKGLEYAIRALPSVHGDARMVAVGGVTHLGSFEALARELGVRDRVVFTGPVYGPIQPYFFAADAFVFPTLFDPFGTVVLEAMAAGLPVVTSRDVGAAELIADGEDGFILENQRSPREIAEKINAALEGDRGRRMGERARETARACTWDEKAKEMICLYERECRQVPDLASGPREHRRTRSISEERE